MKAPGVLLFLHLLLVTPPQKTQVLSQSLSNDTEPRIVGGYSCDVRTIPFLVAIFTRQMCGGTLLTFSWVLTASHCIKPVNLEGVETSAMVRAGYNLPKNFVQVRRIKQAIMHPYFRPERLKADKELRFDIGLIELDHPFEPSPVTQLAKMPKKGDAAKCSTVMAVGIGLTDGKEKIGTNLDVIMKRKLMCVELKAYHDISVCQDGYPNAKLDHTVFCTSDPGKDTCSGDSGGPLICESTVVGLVSYGPKICGTGVATYTKVEEYLDFISSHVIESESTGRSQTIVDKSNAQKHRLHTNALFLMLILALGLF